MITTNGTFEATVVGAFVGESKDKKTPYYGIEFETVQGDTMEWIAYLTDNTKERNLDTLLKLGFKGTRVSDLADDKKSIADLFDIPEEKIYIVINDETYENADGEEKTRKIVQFVNVGSRIAKFDHKQAVATFKSLNFDGDLARIRKTGPVKKAKDPTAPPTTAQQASATGQNFTTDDVPF